MKKQIIEIHKNKKAFTLIELLVVMAIIILMSGIAVSAYFGIMRGSGMRSAISHLRSVLQLARQSAILHGRNVYIIFGQNPTNSWYIICRQEGTATGAGGIALIDEYADFRSSLEGGYIYNLDTGERSKVSKVVSRTELTTQDAIWGAEGSYPRYGWEIYPETRLPKGFQFGRDSPPKTRPTPWIIRFNSDGSVRGTDYEIFIHEKLRLGPKDAYGRVIVKAFTGFVQAMVIPASD